MKKIVSHSLLFLFILQLAGLAVFFEFEHYQLKKEVRHLIQKKIPIQNLTLLKFTSTENSKLIWHDAKEFEWKNKLFDVVRFKKLSDDTYCYYVFSDIQEDSLMAKINQTVSQNFPNEKQPTPVSKVLKVFKTPLFFENTPVQNIEGNFISKISAIFNYTDLFSTSEQKIELPPPEIS